MSDLSEFESPRTVNNLVDKQHDLFIVDSDGEAEWALRKLAHANQQIADFEQIASDETDRVARWLQAVCDPLDHDRAYFIGQLEFYARGQREDGRKTITLPHGTVATRPIKQRIAITDPDLLLTWARDNHPDAITVKESVSLTALSKVATIDDGARDDTGHTIPGTEVTPESISVKVTTS